MQEKIQIISDGSLDLSRELTRERDILVVPFYVSFDGETYLKEGVELDIREYIEVVGYQICDNSRDYPVTGEGMNWFVKDELFPMESRKVLLLQFQEKQPGHYLNESMVRFVISQMQLEISEYRCVGVIL